MISPDLPAELKAALDIRLQGVSLNDVADRAALISRTYRGGGSSVAIRTAVDALAYALVRMPATYAAVGACLNALCEVRPDFAPRGLLDAGAGPGTASWAAAEALPSLTDFTSIDANVALRTLALDLSRDSSRLQALNYQRGEALTTLATAEQADFVIASYIVGEIADVKQAELAELLWSRTLDTLLVVEPGTPAGYRRIATLRERLIARGAHVAAPCPHDFKCPLQAPDWCHFTQRLPRLRAHKQLKGADLPYEDEKFSYVALTRSPPTQRPPRVLAQPVINKAEINARLCTPAGIANVVVPRRDKTSYQRFKKISWGDAIFEQGNDTE